MKKSSQYVVLSAPARPENPTPLELAIYNFEKKCAAYHSKERLLNVETLPPEQQAKHAASQRAEWQHLQGLKAALIAHEIHVSMQSDLAKYRAGNKNKSPMELAREEHHPTKKLANNLLANGEIMPSPAHAAHHIIMGKGKYLKVQMMAARLNLHIHGVGINDPDNGVWLVHNRSGSETWRTKESSPEKPRHWATPDSPVHLPMHTKNYETWISTQFSPRGVPAESFKRKLNSVKAQLKTGSYPRQIEEQYDPSWEGKV
ncbi:MAG: AHH domain-containing protein [Marinobacter sp.]|nr:AHH domain-containing protein [Marinobacter sp.]